MDSPIFDAMLKNALEEAIRLDVEETPVPPPPSRRQRRRMRKLLAAGAARREGHPRTPARWLAVVVVAALLTGTAAGYALGGGERFRRMYEESVWAQRAGGAMNTEQLLDMGAGIDTALVEADGLRFEVLDAVSDGQRAMVDIRLTVLDPDLLEQVREDPGGLGFGEQEIVPETGEPPRSSGLRICSWTGGEALEEGQYSLLCSMTDESLSEGGRYSFCLRDLTFWTDGGEETTLRSGTWTLTVTLRPTEVLRLEPERVCRIEEAEWLLERVTLSPLALQMSFRRLSGNVRTQWYPFRDLEIHMEDGSVVTQEDCVTGIGAGDRYVDGQLEFPMPLDLERVAFIRVCGEEIPLER